MFSCKCGFTCGTAAALVRHCERFGDRGGSHEPTQKTQDVIKLNEQFNILDKNGDRKLDINETTRLLRLGTTSITESEIQTVFRSADKNGDKYIDFDEFIEHFFSRSSSKDRANSGASTESKALSKSLSMTADAFRYARVSISSVPTGSNGATESGEQRRSSICSHGSDSALKKSWEQRRGSKSSSSGLPSLASTVPRPGTSPVVSSSEREARRTSVSMEAAPLRKTNVSMEDEGPLVASEQAPSRRRGSESGKAWISSMLPGAQSERPKSAARLGRANGRSSFVTNFSSTSGTSSSSGSRGEVQDAGNTRSIFAYKSLQSGASEKSTSSFSTTCAPSSSSSGSNYASISSSGGRGESQDAGIRPPSGKTSMSRKSSISDSVSSSASPTSPTSPQEVGIRGSRIVDRKSSKSNVSERTTSCVAGSWTSLSSSSGSPHCENEDVQARRPVSGNKRLGSEASEKPTSSFANTWAPSMSSGSRSEIREEGTRRKAKASTLDASSFKGRDSPDKWALQVSRPSSGMCDDSRRLSVTSETAISSFPHHSPSGSERGACSGVRLWIVRHGRSANKNRSCCEVASSDPALSEVGYEQAEQVGKRLAKDLRYFKPGEVIIASSPMRRCLLTIRPAVHQLCLAVDDCICHGGCYEFGCAGLKNRGTNASEIMSSFPEFTLVGFNAEGNWDYQGCHEKENEAEAKDRALRVTLWIWDVARILSSRQTKRRILVLSLHQTLADLICQLLVDETSDRWQYGDMKYKLGNGGITEIVLEENGSAHFSFQNDCSHLVGIRPHSAMRR